MRPLVPSLNRPPGKASAISPIPECQAEDGGDDPGASARWWTSTHLVTDADCFACLDGFHNQSARFHVWQQILKAIRLGAHNQNCNVPAR
jgi:hypothetical protein